MTDKKTWIDRVDAIQQEEVQEEEVSNISEHKLIRARIRAFLDLIGWSEGTSTIKGSDDGYNVMVGGKLFYDYSDHPRVVVDIPAYGVKSSAAGKYQILSRYWDHYKRQLGLKDFSPESQDKYAMNMFREVGCMEDIENGNIETAIQKCASRWASFPGAGYGQREIPMEDMLAKYDELLYDKLKRHDV